MAHDPNTVSAKLYSYSIKQVLAIRRAIATDPDLLALIGPPLKAAGYDVLAGRLQELLPGEIDPIVIRDSLVHLAGEKFTRELLDRTAWLFAGNLRRLKKFKAVVPWRTQRFHEWVPMQIIDQIPYRNKRRDAGTILTFRILAGTPCTLTTERFWTLRFCRYVAREELGFTNARGVLPYEHNNELTGLRLYGLIDAGKSLGKPIFDQVRATSSFVEYNRNLLKARKRDGFQCPKNYKHACRLCPIGYDRCPVAVHPRTFVKIACDTCKRTNWADPQHAELKLCIECFNKKQLTIKK